MLGQVVKEQDITIDTLVSKVRHLCEVVQKLEEQLKEKDVNLKGDSLGTL